MTSANEEKQGEGKVEELRGNGERVGRVSEEKLGMGSRGSKGK